MCEFNALDFASILEDVQSGDISIREASERLGWLESGVGTTCDTCKHFQADICHRPGHPPRAEHPLSVRCGDYEKFDKRDYALPAEPVRRGSRMWK